MKEEEEDSRFNNDMLNTEAYIDYTSNPPTYLTHNGGTTSHSMRIFNVSSFSSEINIPRPLYSIGDEVYHITPESAKGYILDMRYYFNTKTVQYLVTFGPGNDTWLIDAEMTRVKNVI